MCKVCLNSGDMHERFVLWALVGVIVFAKLGYWVVGGGSPKDVAARWGRVQGVKVMGFVDDLASVYAAANAVVCPIYSGSGTCIKTVEPLMYGRVVIGSPFAFRGWTDEQKSQPFVKVGKTDLAALCCEYLHSDGAVYKSVSPQQIRAWADEQFGERVFDAAVRDMVFIGD